MKSFLIFYITMVTVPSFGQSTTSPVQTDSAMLYLTGTFKDYNPAKAFTIFMQRANTGDAKAMNAVGLQYLKGLGVDTNYNLAIYWLTQAGNNGYAKAWVNLGMLKKRTSTDSLGYASAVYYFNKALQEHEPSAYFALGYMYYKGLGCGQSYSQALSLFQQGSAMQRADCMYFIGLCFKYGYGVNINADSATYYIDKAARNGYKQANAELSSLPVLAGRGSTTSQSISVSPLKEATEVYHKQEFKREYTQINGTYSGILTEYDYSGSKIIREVPLTIRLYSAGNRISGSLCFENSQEAIPLEGVQSGNKLVFSSATFISQVQKARAAKQRIVFKSITFSLETVNDSTLLKGSIELYNTYTRETGRPISLTLAKQARTDENLISSTVSVYPNPVSKTFSISVNVENDSPLKINIYSPSGQLIYTKFTNTLGKGRQTIAIETELPSSGIYFLSVTGNNLRQTIAFVKD